MPVKYLFSLHRIVSWGLVMLSHNRFGPRRGRPMARTLSKRFTAVAVEMWKSRVSGFRAISERGGNRGKIAFSALRFTPWAGLFHGFHGASFPQQIWLD